MTPRLIVTLLVTCLVLLGETDYRFAFPQSELLFGIDLKWLKKNQLTSRWVGEAKDNLGELKPLEALIDQIDSVYVSAVTKQGAKPVSRGAKEPKEMSSELLILVKGRFDLEKLVEFGGKNGYKVDNWGKTRVMLPKVVSTPKRPVPALPQVPKKLASGPVRFTNTAYSEEAQYTNAQLKMDVPKMDLSGSKPLFALIDNRNVLVGEEGPLRVALERMEGGLTPQANPIFDRARNLEAEHDVWIVGSTAPLNLDGALAAKPGEKQDPMAQLASQIRNFSVGLAMRRDVNFDIQLQTANPKAATQMLDMAKGFAAMAKMAKKPEEELPIDLDRALELTANGSIFRASLTIEEKDVERLVASTMQSVGGVMGAKPQAKKQESAAGPVMTPAKPAPPAAMETPKVELAAKAETPKVEPPKAPEPPARKTVMIYGLPGGPKEVPVH